MSVVEESHLQIPCDFPIKVMGANDVEFEARVIELVRRHAPDLGDGSVRRRTSQGNRYVSLTVTVRAATRAQLDRIYRDLTGCDAVLVVL